MNENNHFAWNRGRRTVLIALIAVPLVWFVDFMNALTARKSGDRDRAERRCRLKPVVKGFAKCDVRGEVAQ